MRGIGPQSAEKLAARGLSRLRDLWLWLPREYEDRTRLTPIAQLQPGIAAQVEGRILATETAFRFRPMLKVAINDGGLRRVLGARVAQGLGQGASEGRIHKGASVVARRFVRSPCLGRIVACGSRVFKRLVLKQSYFKVF